MTLSAQNPTGNGESLVAHELDRRGPDDRRRTPTPIFSRYTLLGGRRRVTRRGGTTVSCFVDQWGPGLFLTVTAIAALNFLDAWFTILLLSWGGTEMNPLIDAVLRWGTWPFIFVKSIGIGTCVAVLTLTSRFRVAQFGLGIVLAGYTLLLGWHLYLIQALPTS